MFPGTAGALGQWAKEQFNDRQQDQATADRLRRENVERSQRMEFPCGWGERDATGI